LVGLDEKHRVVAENLLIVGSVLPHPLHAATPFIGEGARPNLGVGSAEKGVKSFGSSCDRIEHLAGDGGIVLDGLGEKEVGDAAVSPGVKAKTEESSSGTFAVNWVGRDEQWRWRLGG
jgi:hypothetical protein